VKFYRGSARAARNYLEATRTRADDYYLSEREPAARRYEVTGEGELSRLGGMAGDGYQAWVAGIDPQTGEQWGRVREDGHAVRFAEVVVNGPKSWSIAAELHEDIAAAYEAAQDAAAEQIVAWMGEHVTTRVGPRGEQVATPVERLEAAVVRHYTSRAGDPHRHLHVQINARVAAAGKWRGVDTVAVRNAIEAVHGIGHAAVIADAGFRQALASHGFSLDAETGEVAQLARYVAPLSKRAAQIARQVEGYEAAWRAENPARMPGPALRRAWDARAWAEQRPGKTHGETAEAARRRWADELRALGFRQPRRAAELRQVPIARLDRKAAAEQVLARATALRSAFNPADLRGEADQLIARTGIIAEASVRAELAEDLTARAVRASAPLLDRPDVPEHVRAFTSPAAIAVEDDLSGRLALRAATVGVDAPAQRVQEAAEAAGGRLDAAQAQAVAALCGDHALVLVAGAAGAGKTTTLAATRALLEADGHRLMVVAPTLKAARAVRQETGAAAGSAAWLAHQHGWRWDADGRWTRLAPGQVDPVTGREYTGPAEGARLSGGDLVVVDEAGMADQDTARALCHVTDEHDARLALVGDPHQLAAVGRGGVLDLTQRWAERQVSLDVIHRFTRSVEIEPGIRAELPDDSYAELSLRMRDGRDPGAVFDTLAERGLVRVYGDEQVRRDGVAREAAAARAAGRPAAVAVATHEQARELNAAIRERLVAARVVDDKRTVSTGAGETVGAGDAVATRRNDRETGVANRDTWTVGRVHDDGRLTVTGAQGQRELARSYVAEHVELAYAATVHGVQGETAHSAHLVLDTHTDAAAAYVGMTRGRTTNTVHLVAEDQAAARAQWIDAASRQRADLGVAAAREHARQAAAPYAQQRSEPSRTQQRRLARVLDELHEQWAIQTQARQQLDTLGPRLQAAQADANERRHVEQILHPLRERVQTAAEHAEAAEARAETARAGVDERAQQIGAALRGQWDAERPIAAQAAETVREGSGGRMLGRLSGRRRDLRHDQALLEQWGQRWQDVLPELSNPAVAAHAAGWRDDASRIGAGIDQAAHRQAEQSMPEQMRLIDDAVTARAAARDAQNAYDRGHQQVNGAYLRHASTRGWHNTHAELPEFTRRYQQAQRYHDDATARIDQLGADPAVRAQPDPDRWLADAHQSWQADYSHQQAQSRARERVRAAREAAQRNERQAAQRRRGLYRSGPSRDRGGYSR
jgi:conjugative relaxase-like TrwC/TraI family protein